MADPRPVILVVERDFRELKPLAAGLADGPFRLVTCPVESVALEFVAGSRPAAVVMDARTLFLEGAACLERWTAASPGTRVLFLDVDGPWCLLMELPSADPGQVTINPCGAAQVAAAIEEALSRPPGSPAGRSEVPDDRMAVVVV